MGGGGGGRLWQTYREDHPRQEEGNIERGGHCCRRRAMRGGLPAMARECDRDRG